ncbi:SLC13 family permease [Vulcanisaeta distributa]|uniref:Citrate transporter n=1 Tax=Vulcanisaeta distributa (strain DSM 14429 / JCM 11212 / NBRC 100878 / IC-017) TaxID=572478 RepID=E1QSZ6_VULDI|nr:SLC13 family permease [Vulcanisaeta distributa]ADN50863.1 Citrate transporter [Vulcanisaeta distributa DSM 14429]
MLSTKFIEDSIILAITYGLIALRGIGKINVQPWVAMLFGAALTIVLGILTPNQALSSINLNVILFLISLFTISSALEVSGFFSYLAYKLLISSRGMGRLILRVFGLSAILSLALSNDGIAGSFTPVIVSMRRQARINIKPLLYALAFGVTIGSVALPVGNPQNLLIALESGMPRPFIVFALYLLPPTIINILVTYPLLLLLFRNNNDDVVVEEIRRPEELLVNKRLAYTAITILLILIPLYFITDIFNISPYLTPVTLTFMSASIIYLLSGDDRRSVAHNVDWTTILFFIGLFIVSEGALESGVLNSLAHYLPQPTTLIGVFISGLLLSQVISNVPMVALYIPLMRELGVSPSNYIIWVGLAASSTIAGNLTLIGAASNVIISEASEKRGGEGFGFLEFMKYGIPVTIVNTVIYYVWLNYVHITF